jgi:hypothetical protein
MSNIKTFTINNVRYNAVMLSAVQQDELLSVLTSTIMQRGLNASINNVELGDSVLVPMFMSMSQDVKNKVAGKLMHMVAYDGTSEKVTINNFTGDMVNYNKLLSQLLLWNLADFFDWLHGVLESEKPPMQPTPNPQP